MKKKLQYLLIVSLFAIFTIFFAACGEIEATDFNFSFSSYYVIGQSLDTLVGKVNYSDGSIKEIALRDCLVSGLDNTKLGKQTITVTYEKMVKTFELEFRAQYNVTYSAGEGGSIIGNLFQQVAEGASSNVVTAIPDVGYLFKNWSDGSTRPKHTVSAVTEECYFTATFEKEVITKTLRVYSVDFENSKLNKTNFSNTPLVKTVSIGSVETLKPNAQVGFEFLGYIRDRNSAGVREKSKTATLTFEVLPNSLDYTIQTNIDLYPVYAPYEYLVKFIDDASIADAALGYEQNIISTAIFNEYDKKVDLFAMVNTWLNNGVREKFKADYEYNVFLENSDGEREKITADLKFTSFTLTERTTFTKIVIAATLSNCTLTIMYNDQSFFENDYVYGTTKNYNELWEILRLNGFPFTNEMKYLLSCVSVGDGEYFDRDETAENAARSITLNTDNTIVTVKAEQRTSAVTVYNTPALYEKGEIPNYTPAAVYQSATIKYGEKYARPRDPFYKSDFLFYNYYQDLECTELFDFSMQIKANTVIYCGYFVKQTFASTETTAELSYTRLDNTVGTRLLVTNSDFYIKYGASFSSSENKKTLRALVKEGSATSLVLCDTDMVPRFIGKLFKGFKQNNAVGAAIDMYAPVRSRMLYFAEFETAKYTLLPIVTSDGIPFNGGKIYVYCAGVGHNAKSSLNTLRDGVYYYTCGNTACHSINVYNGEIRVEHGSAVYIGYAGGAGIVSEAVKINGQTILPQSIFTEEIGGETVFFVKADARIDNVSNDSIKIEYKIKTQNFPLSLVERNSLTKVYARSGETLTEIANNNGYQLPYGADIVLKIKMFDGWMLETLIVNGLFTKEFIYDIQEKVFIFVLGKMESAQSVEITSKISIIDVTVIDSGTGVTNITDDKGNPISTVKYTYGSSVYFVFTPGKSNGLIFMVENIYIGNLCYIKNGKLNTVSDNIVFTFNEQGACVSLKILSCSENIEISVVYEPISIDFNVSISGANGAILEKINLDGNEINVKSSSFTYDETKNGGKLSYGASIGISYTVPNGYKVSKILVNGVAKEQLPTTLTENMKIEIICEKTTLAPVSFTASYGENAEKYGLEMTRFAF